MGHVFYDEEVIDVEPVTTKTLQKKLITLLGGVAGEEVMCGDVSNGSSDDVGKARTLIQSLMCTGSFGFDKLPSSYNTSRFSYEKGPISQKRLQDIEQKESELLSEAFERAKTIISNNKELVEILFKELKQNEKLSKREIETILKEREVDITKN